MTSTPELYMTTRALNLASTILDIRALRFLYIAWKEIGRIYYNAGVCAWRCGMWLCASMTVRTVGHT
jgi:hypothetical protein